MADHIERKFTKKHQEVSYFLNYDAQLEYLCDHGLLIDDVSSAKSILATASFHNLENYDDLLLDEYGNYSKGMTLNDLYNLYLLDKSVQNVLFQYSTHIETIFKTALGYIIAKNISEEDFYYLSENAYKNGKQYVRKLNRTLKALRATRDKSIDNPTLYYRQNCEFIPPWILFVNVTFSTCIDLSDLLWAQDRQELIDSILAVSIPEDSRSDYVKDSLNTIRKFRNAIAHNLEFISMRIPKQQKINFRRAKPAFLGTMLHDEDQGIRCDGDPFSMIIAIISLIKEPNLVSKFFYDLGLQLRHFSDEKIFSKYCVATGLPVDILKRGNKFCEAIRGIGNTQISIDDYYNL